MKIVSMRTILFLIFLCLLPVVSWGQISQGGYPKEVVQIKSTSTPITKMPAVNNLRLLKVIIDEQKTEPKLKPFKFAHAFDVDLTTNNSGKWYKTNDNTYCWKLKIQSKGAKSINLIFDKFKLPKEARLFIYNEKENHVLGAFTSLNNKSSEKFAVSPVKGDEITVQYEIPFEYINERHFRITRVNHDFIGILDYNERRPLGEIAGECNVDVNCDFVDEWNEIKNSVCRLIVNGVEICSGTLVNNTTEDQTPYILSAAHCYDKWEYAATTIYAFNYESPYCAPLDGDPSNSISGALMKAQFDSLDFALVELSSIPPPEFRPYFAGWNHSTNLPDSTISIHHPQGDIKKIAMDGDAPVISDFNSNYLENGFLEILRWDMGVTEVGSSGGPLFDTNKNIIGTLTGGVASCSNPIRDYFERFALSWDYKADSSKQLKHWLDPLNSSEKYIDGKQFYKGENLCNAFTNLTDNDEHKNISLLSSDEFSGYWGGTNSVGITEFMERFSIFGNEQLAGISLGVGKITKNTNSNESEITIKVYNGSYFPETIIYSKNISVKDLVQDAMNFIGFDEIIEPSDTFFVGFELSNMQPSDTFVVYQSLRPANTENFFYFKQNDIWQSFEDANLGYNSLVNVFELIACNIDDTISDIPEVEVPTEIKVFPNPTQEKITLEADSEIKDENVTVYNLLGQKVDVQFSKMDIYHLSIDLSGNVPGIYFIRFNYGENSTSKKISFVPW